MPEKTEKRVEYNYIFPDDYNPLYVNGAFGGISPQGEITCNFFMDRLPLPKSETYSVDEKGVIRDRVQEKSEEQNYQVVRYVQSGVIMNLDCAKRVNVWLTQQIEAIEKAMEKARG